jgi:hypothetical protein
MPTGPCLLGYVFSKCNLKDKYNLEIAFTGTFEKALYIYKNTVIMERYATYRQEQNTTYYATDWKNKNIYDKSIIINLADNIISTETRTQLIRLREINII